MLTPVALDAMLFNRVYVRLFNRIHHFLRVQLSIAFTPGMCTRTSMRVHVRMYAYFLGVLVRESNFQCMHVRVCVCAVYECTRTRMQRKHFNVPVCTYL